MKCPINYADLPVKRKYVEDHEPVFARWYVFGQTPDGAFVDIAASSEGPEVLHGVPREKVAEILNAREGFLERVWEILERR